MKILFFIVLTPIVLGVISFRLEPELFVVGGELDVPSFWGFLGIVLGYVGCVFSAYALIEVRRLSQRYFAKQRLPELKKQIQSVRKRMDELKDLKLMELRADGFLGEVRVLTKQLNIAGSPGFSEVVKRTKKLCKEVEKKVKENESTEFAVNDLGEFWDLYTSLSEISDEIHAFQQANKASL